MSRDRTDAQEWKTRSRSCRREAEPDEAEIGEWEWLAGARAARDDEMGSGAFALRAGLAGRAPFSPFRRRG